MSSKTFNNTKINVEFDEDYQSRTNINSGENISSLFAKIRRFMLDLKPVALSGSYNDLIDKPEIMEILSSTDVNNLISVENASDNVSLLETVIYGMSWQDEIPSANSFALIHSICDDANIDITTNSEKAINVNTTSFKGYGIPFDTGNYTDSDGQHWVSDKIIINANRTGKIIRYNGTITFDGSADENWSLSSSNTRIMTNAIKTIAKPNPSTVSQSPNIMPCLSNSLIAISPYSSINGAEGIAIDYTATLAITFADMVGNSNLNEWITYLAEHPVTVIYQLASPTESELTESELIDLQLLIDKYENFSANFMSRQYNIPKPDAPKSIVTTADLYRFSSANIVLNTPLRGIPVSDNGNYTDGNGQQWLADELIISADGTGKIVQNIGVTIFDGSADENWSLSDSGTRIMTNAIKSVAKPNPNAVGQSRNIMPCLCDQLTAISPYMSINGQEGVAIDYTTTLAFTFADLVGNSSLTAWTDRLTEHPVTVVYQLSTSIETYLSFDDINNFVRLKTYNGLTNISNSENAYMLISYWRNTSIANMVNNALSLKGGEMQGILIAQSNTDYTTPQVRNVSMSTEAATGGNNGQIHFQYV